MSKRIWNHPEVPQDETTVSWRSPGQLRDTREFRTWMDREFPRGAAEMENQDEMETSRRTFLKLMGSSTALAGFGMVACRRPEAYIVPYTKAPEWVIPGKATYYASSMPRADGAVPLVVTTFEGRPTKVGPNRLHPDYGGTDCFAQASVLDMYSSSRSRKILKNGIKDELKNFQMVLGALTQDKAAKIGFVFGKDDGPTRLRLVGELKNRYSAAKFYQYEALSDSDAAILGDGVKIVPDFANADRIVSLDCDFAGTDSQGSTIAFFNRRKPEGKGYTNSPDAGAMNRLYSIESAFTLTGGMADHRLRVAPGQIAAVAAQLARELGASAGEIAPITDAKQVAWIKELAADLKASGGKTAVIAGSRQSAAVKHLALAINIALGNLGEGKGLRAYQTEATGFGGIADLTADLNSGTVETVVMMTPSNPVYDAPADLEFSGALAKAKTSIHLGERTNATAFDCDWHIPAAHYLESWNDSRSATGVYTIVQPMILPLYPECVSELELLLGFLAEDGKIPASEGEDGAPAAALTAVKETFNGDDAAWKSLLKNGFAADNAYAAADPAPAGSAGADLAKAGAKDPTKGSLDVIFATDASVYDGRWIDNGWLQEAPDPVTKLTWDNAALIAPNTAKDLGIYDLIQELEPKKSILGVKQAFADVGPDGEGENRSSPMIIVKVNGKSLEVPVLVSFGQAENTIIIPLGYGQGFNDVDELERDAENAKFVGLVGVNSGFDAYPLRTQETSYFATGATVSLTEKRYSVALTQEHNAMYGRALAREISTDEVDHKGDFAAQLKNVRKQGNDSHAPVNLSLYMPESSATWNPGKDGNAQSLLSDPLHQWGMSIDLSACMGCNACLVACQAENNIPIVGKEQVAKGREMHWIRMDRYFATHKDNDFDADNVALVPQPVACVQCEAAPCETVCPVNATVHTEDGLNAMAYNRCIGTRYCANNCPYKARRFNFFDYNKRNPLIKNNLNRGPLGERHDREPNSLQKNPNVTVRMRGVMEKCTYCVQRLKAAVIRQKRGQRQEVLESPELSPNVPISNESLRIPVGSVKTACQDACPAEAISFGNLLDGTASELGRTKTLERNYDLLNYIGTRPRTSYLARVKNPNPRMPDARFVGQSTIHMV